MIDTNLSTKGEINRKVSRGEDILKSCDGGITRTSIVFLSSKDLGAMREPLVLKIYTVLKFLTVNWKHLKKEIESVL